MGLKFSLVITTISLFHLHYHLAHGAEGSCIWYGECNEVKGRKQNCAYDGPPLPLKGDADALRKIKSLCPDLVSDNATEPHLCCDAAQIHTFDNNMGAPRQLIARCPSCFHNFAQLWCWSTCSPVQAEFLVATEIQNNTETPPKPYVNAVDYHLTEDFAEGMFNSCSSVQYPGSNQLVLELLCGTKDCTPKKWLSFLGDVNQQAPFAFNFILQTPNASNSEAAQKITPMNSPSVPCNKAYRSSDFVCSCQDCKASCADVAPYDGPVIGEDCAVGNMECTVFVSILLAGVSLVAIVMVALHLVVSGTPVVKYAAAGQAASTESFKMIDETDVPLWERMGSLLEQMLEDFFQSWGKFCTRHPFVVFLFGLLVSLAFSFGLFYLKVTVDPVELWSSPTSTARLQKKIFDESFGPFYRTEQIIIVPKNLSFWPSTNFYEEGQVVYGPALRKDVMEEAIAMQQTVLRLTAEYNGRNVTLSDICFKPLAPDNNLCTIQSVTEYLQNDLEHLNKITFVDEYFQLADYTTHLKECFSGPTLTKSNSLGLSCLSEAGSPIFPFVALGGFEGDAYENATVQIITFVVSNQPAGSDELKMAQAWEAKFLEYIKNYKSEKLEIIFSAERSIEDEIDRESQSDVATIVISYSVMFFYIAFSLGQYNVYNNNLLYFLVQSKIVLGLVGVIIVILSVTSSIGIYAFMDIPATLIIVEVVPFLVLAVGVDNIFILVQAYQRDQLQKGESIEDRIGRISGEVIPTMLLSSFSECFCFFLGALSTMPAVRTFSLYAGMAIAIDFFLQITMFLAIYTLDIRRQEKGRLEICCCISLAPQQGESEGFLQSMVKDYYAPVLLTKWVRITAALAFIAWLCASISVLGRIEVGLDQKLSMPEDSYLLRYFDAINNYLHVGPPVYFVVDGEYDYSNLELQNLICSGGGCLPNSLSGQIFQAAQSDNKSYIAHPVSSWIDDYFSWLDPNGDIPCCRVNTTSGGLCPSSVPVSPDCIKCNASLVNGRPTHNTFDEFIHFYLKDNPNTNCAKGGHAAYGNALAFDNQTPKIKASYFMTYHTIFRTNDDYVNALINARYIADTITATINKNLTAEQKPVTVFPYSIYYVFYEQYLTVVHDTIIQLLISVAAIFVVSTIALGLDPWSAFCIVIVIVMIVIDMMGMMHWWSISLNAVSLVNLVMAVGISVEFCSHIVRSNSISLQATRLERAREALSTMGSSVLSGITLTKFGGIIVLAFSHSQIFQIFYFRMYLGIVLIGAAHGLIFLPVLLSFIGPPMKKHRMLQKQRHELLDLTTQRSTEDFYNPDV